MKPSRKVRFRLAWQTYRKGDVIEPNGLLRDWLLANGYVVPVEPSAPPVPASATPPVPQSLPVPEPPAERPRKRPRPLFP